MLGAFLEDSPLRGVDAAHVVVAMDDMKRSVATDPEMQQVVREALLAAFGRPLELRIVPLAAGEQPRRATPQDVKPMIDRAIAFFDGEVMEPQRKKEQG